MGLFKSYFNVSVSFPCFLCCRWSYALRSSFDPSKASEDLGGGFTLLTSLWNEMGLILAGSKFKHSTAFLQTSPTI